MRPGPQKPRHERQHLTTAPMGSGTVSCNSPASRYLLPAAPGADDPGGGATVTGPSPSFSSASLLCPTGPTITTGHSAGLIHFVTTRLMSARVRAWMRPGSVL